MGSLKNAVGTICTMEELALRDIWLNRRHPLIKLLVTLGYILAVTSVHKYAIMTLILLSVYPVVLFAISGARIYQGFYRLKIVLLMTLFVGIANPIFDTLPMGTFCGVIITGGMVSFVSLAIKGFLTIAASYLLMVSTTIKDICIALRIMRVPSFFLTQILLMYRYSIVVLHTLSDMQVSYQLRSARKRGIAVKEWGTFAGQLLLHSFYRAEQLYQSMLLRNYNSEKFCLVGKKMAIKDIWYLFFWWGFFLLTKVLGEL